MTKTWAEMSNSERRLAVLVPLAHTVLNLISNEMDSLPDGKPVVIEIERAKEAFARFDVHMDGDVAAGDEPKVFSLAIMKELE